MIINDDTIAAISTPIGYGGISIIRISGKDAFSVCEQLFVRPNGKTFSEQNPSEICYGHICAANGEILDEVLVSKMKAPHTFTAEDVAEINCHGGLAAVTNVLGEVLACGVRAAEAGEFTKRAFLNGRIDLSQAEAVSDVIDAKTALAAKAALAQLGGQLSEEINEIKQMILTLLADLEVTIQYPEYDIPEVTTEELLNKLKQIEKQIERLINSYHKGEILREGIKIVIAGRPNVGKSLLLNRIIRKDKAIVTDVPGTTRDIVDESINIGGIPVNLIDTAGIRESEDLVETLGIRRSWDSIESADVILFVADVSNTLSEEDKAIYESIRTMSHIVVLNKEDAGVSEETVSYFRDSDSVLISALTKHGLDALEHKLSAFAFGEGADITAEAIVSNARHKFLLDVALSSIQTAMQALNNGMPIDFLETDIRDAWEALGKITGETISEDIIDEIFSKFCLGK